MIDIAIIAIAFVSLLVAATLILTDHDAVKRHVGEHDAT